MGTTGPPRRRRWPRTKATTLWLLWAVVLAAGLALALLAYSVRYLPVDLAIAKELQQPRVYSGVLAPVMIAVSVPGYTPWTEALFAAAVALLALARRWRDALLIALGGLGDVIGLGLKLIIARPRPGADLVEVYREMSGFSFPSGHVLHYVVFYGVLAYLSWRALRAVGERRGTGLLLLVGLAGCLTLIALVGASRVFLGAHWPSDVLGGYLIGGAWLAGLVALYRRWVSRGWSPEQIWQRQWSQPDRQPAAPT
jgi:undecaprenyl-diphosphatase